MLKAVIDTNIFISAVLGSGGICRNIIRYAINGMFQPLMGQALFNEYEDVLSRMNLFVNCSIPLKKREELFNAFLASCKWVRVFYKWRPNLRDEADNHLIELAIAGGAQTIVTKNIRDLKSGELYFEQFCILTPYEFMEICHEHNYFNLTR
ncbi:putative toxin-antitoxin system toxin component, PIN family [Candidatus Magnetomoraceae bacterium gMMP-15]